MEDVLIENLKKPDVFKRAFGLGRAWFALFLSGLFVLFALGVMALWLVASLLAGPEAAVVIGVSVVIALLTYAIESFIYRSRFKKYYDYFMAADKRIAPCRFIRDDIIIRKRAPMVVSTYVLQREFNTVSEAAAEEVASKFELQKYSFLAKWFSSGRIPRTEINSKGADFFPVSIFVGFSGIVYKDGVRTPPSSKMIVTEKYLYYVTDSRLEVAEAKT